MPMNGNARMVECGMGSMPMMDSTSGFQNELQDGNHAILRMDTDRFDMDPANRNQNRNRGNYRCSKCGEPKKGHVCPLVPSNFKCNRCGLSRKSCSCVAPALRSIGVQVEMDQDMTTRELDLSVQGVEEFHKATAGCSTPNSS
ncbi:unnamed protein product [Peronospora belbahrii]|uniref:Zn(2)-C6 fungal-type domain-containing protein n=1 Tax=Peronospora belbahrii TaxID=622444 RepID=A0ABN8DBH6_9STRA|nr:unnamed protein product [Peronospora belbahrii]